MTENTASPLLEVLVCPSCGSRVAPSETGPAVLVCAGCRQRTPVVNSIPRFVHDDQFDTSIAGQAARRTRESFGYEWTHFNDWQQSGETNLNDYFQGLALDDLSGKVVLDAGCGMGRHARQIARYARHVVAVDFSRAIDQAARNVAGLTNVDCVQADLLALPLADCSFDYVYSLGVLHHLTHTERALAQLAAKLKPGGRLRVYLYWKRHGWGGRLLSVVNAARRLTTRMPFGLLRACCWILSAMLFPFVVLPYRLLSRIGVHAHESWPLFVYSKYPFNVLYNDQFDRFSAPIEKRYEREEVRTLLEAAGLGDVMVRPCFGWIAEGTRPPE